VHRQHALVGKKILVAEEEKAGDRIGNSMNGEHTRLVLSHFRWMFGNIMAVKYQQLAHILSLYFGQIYGGARPSSQSRLVCWLFGNLSFNLTNVLDRLATAKDKSTKKPVTQSNHFHILAEEIPRFHEGCDIPLFRLPEEAGEAYQKVSKEAGLKRSDRKSDKVQTMYREEWMRDEAILKYGLRGRDAEKSKSSSLFAESIMPNLLIPSCIYNIDAVSHQTFAKLMLLLTRQPYALPLLFVYLPPGVRSQTQLLPPRAGKGCQCICYCKCHGCSKDCLCKCPPDCPHCRVHGSCKCKLEPVVLALTGQGQGEEEFLLLQWCDEASSSANEGQHLSGAELTARVKGLLQAHRDGSQLVPEANGELLPLLPYWQSASALSIQAAYRMHLHKGVLQDATAKRKRLEQGEQNWTNHVEVMKWAKMHHLTI
jgi:hypothetical protein